MQLGIALPNFSRLGTREAVVDIARRAEALGYDSVWTTDHVMMTKGQEEPYGHILEAFTTLAYLAPLTERVKLGTSVIVFPQRNPVLVAKEAATLDFLSDGRLILGVGAGWNEREFRYLGAEFANRGKRLDEYLRALRELWTAPAPRFEGEFVSFSDVLFSPRPVQPGGPPIVIGGASRATFRRAAQLGDGWHAVGVSPRAFADGMHQIGERAGGRPVEGQLRIRTALGRVLPETPNAAGLLQSTLSGSVHQVVARIAEYREAGVSHLVAFFPDEDRETFLDQMRRFAEEVRPAIGPA